MNKHLGSSLEIKYLAMQMYLGNRYVESEYLEVNMYLMMNLCLVSGYLEIEYLEIEYLEIEYLATNANLMKNEHLEA